ncbi:AAA family ATPase [Frankia sp. EAN1pec]|uniref:AAA family ATPase n=1 Tax=Parafrankia sp. (strain EAN1pec) TaxID=298653 RepID=UPI0002E39805
MSERVADAASDHDPGTGWSMIVPAGGVLVVAGIPGAGKSTLIQRLYHGAPAPAPGRGAGPAGGRADDPLVLDSAQVRAALARRLGHLPYALYRPVVHTVHYWRIAAWTAGPRRNLVIHECGTRTWARRTVAALARLRRRPAHLVFLETSPAAALAGQHARGRVVPHRSFRRHERSWARMRAALQDGSLAREGWTFARGISREEAARLTEIRFE